jgi:hypothetical protein
MNIESPPNPVTVTLTPEEQQRTWDFAHALDRKYASSAYLSKRNWARDANAVENWYHSLKAELAVAKHFGLVPPAWELFQGSGDKGSDLLTTFGKEVQVKYRRSRGTDLATKNLELYTELKPDFYVLVWPGEDGADDASADVVGWCTRDEFLARILSRAPVRLAGQRYEMKPEELHSATEALTE